MLLTENNSFWIVDRNPDLEYLKSIDIKDIKVDLGIKDKIVKIKKIFYPKEKFSQEEVMDLMKEKLINCPFCTKGMYLNNIKYNSNNTQTKKYSEVDNMKEVISMVAGQFLGSGIKEVGNYVDVSMGATGKPGFERPSTYLDIVGGLVLAVLPNYVKVPSELEVPMMVAGTQRIADRVVSLTKEMTASGGSVAYRQMSRPVMVSRPASVVGDGLVKID